MADASVGDGKGRSSPTASSATASSAAAKSAAATGAAPPSAAVRTAWRRYTELRDAARRAERNDRLLQAGFVALAFATVLLAVLSASGALPSRPGALGLEQMALVSLLILGSVLLAFTHRAGDRDAGPLLRSGAAEIESSIFLFATVLQDHEGREPWLLEHVRAIRRRVFERLGRELTPRPGERDAELPRIESELAVDAFLQQRVEGQLARQSAQARRLESRHLRLQIAIWVSVGAGLFAAAAGGPAIRLVALAAAATLALFGWGALRRFAAEAGRRREVAFALGQIRDHWRGLPVQDRTGDSFVKLAVTTEKVMRCLWDDAALSARLAVAELSGHEEDLLERILKAPASAALDAAALDAVALDAAALDAVASSGDGDVAGDEDDTAAGGPVAAQAKTPKTAGSQAHAAVRTRRPHAFVVMPFGRKQSAEGKWIDFDAIYRQLIHPALVEAGFEPFRADEEKVSGDILTDMFQELLLADLVIADLSIDNANVFYELGVRHAFRKRGLIHIQSGRVSMPFDIFNVRTLPYSCDASGKPDPAHLEKDRQTIVQCARETWSSGQERIHSPIFNLLDGLTEPDRRALQTPLAAGYWRQHNEWQQLLEVARRRRAVGDLLLLTEEASNPLIQEEAIAQAGAALRGLGLDELARRQYRKGLEINPRNRVFRREEAVHLGRLHQYDEAVVKLRQLLQDEPEDIEAMFALGEIYEDVWIGEFHDLADAGERVEEAYEAADWLKKAIETFLGAYHLDQNHAWTGTKAYYLSVLLGHVARVAEEKARAAGVEVADPEVSVIERQLEVLQGAVRFTLESRARRGVSTYAALVRLGYVALCEADDPRQTTKAFRKALTMAGKNRFYLKFTLDRLRIFEDLGFRPEHTEAAISVFRKQLEAMDAEAGAEPPDYQPPKVFLFEGLAIDPPDDQEGPFPPEMEGEVQARLHETMDRLAAGPQDLAITASASCGGDIIFIEECLERGMHVHVMLPLDKATFIERSVGYAGSTWVQRFHALWNHKRATFFIQEDRVGKVPKGDEAFERSNRWALYSALGHGIDRLRLILLWDGKIRDARGGAYHMLQTVRSHGGQVEHVDTSKFAFWTEAVASGLYPP